MKNLIIYIILLISQTQLFSQEFMLASNAKVGEGSGETPASLAKQVELTGTSIVRPA